MDILQNIPIIHATTVHPWWDNRVSNKMVNGLAEAGYEVYFIVNTYPKEKWPAIDNLTIKTLERKSGIKERMIKSLLAYKKSTSVPHSGIFHFHDPEMIFVGALMRLKGWQVIYDVHEDYYLDIAQKPYLGKITQRVLPSVFRLIEQSFIKLFGFHLINAEKAYKLRYPKGVEILNYPKYTGKITYNQRNNYQKINLIYTGVMMINRGALKFKEILQTDPDIHITFVGKCADPLKQQILDDCSPYSERLKINATPEGVAFDQILSAYKQENWAAGLAVFPDTEFLRDKELTKFFEYIQYSIPILASDFPTWSSLIEGNRIGLCIDSDDIAGTLPKALKILRDNTKWEKIRRNCQQACQHYTWQSQQENLIQFYKKIC